MTSGESNRYTL